MKIKAYKIQIGEMNKYLFALNKDFDQLKQGSSVIIESEKGKIFGKVVGQEIEIDESKISSLESTIKKIATPQDEKQNKKNITDARKALVNAKKIAKELNLNMSILSSYYTFDRLQLVFNYTSDERVDFRELAKKLASIYKTRIELRQIGVRDKAKEIGGIGPCGRFLCCNQFLTDFDSVSINMAKNQFISLKPDKINGICGRLLCCLNYEDEQYTELKKKFPKINSSIKNKNIEGKVVAMNVLKNTISVEKKDKSIVTIDLKELESFE